MNDSRSAEPEPELDQAGSVTDGPAASHPTKPLASAEAEPTDPATEPTDPTTEVDAQRVVVGPPRDLRRILRRFGPAVVAIGIAIFASPLAERWPSKQTVEIALEAPADVTSVSLAVSPRGEMDPIFTATWTFEVGSAPGRIQAQLTTPDGPYDANVATTRKGAASGDETKHVELDGNRITLFAR